MKTHKPSVHFDLDGTLVDTAPDFYVVLNRVLEEAGRAPVSAAQVRQQVSNGARALIRLGFSLGPGDEDFEYWLNRLLDAYEQHLDVESCLFPGMTEVLQQLDDAGIPWGVVTNKPVRFSRPVLQGLGLGERVGAIICPDHVQQRKPDPEGLLLACRQVGADPLHSIYVGDHQRDIEAGRNAGMETVAALFGYIDAGDNPEDWNADHYIHQASELHGLIDTLAENYL
ncbi:MAG: HAD-IA family hydrolase [Alcanivoracaceae bacterium]|nr:HAD-IA family hydrolase [Alcanivoracaceae bacterium]